MMFGLDYACIPRSRYSTFQRALIDGKTFADNFCLTCTDHRKLRGLVCRIETTLDDHEGIEIKDFCISMMKFAFKMMDFVFNMMNFALTMMSFDDHFRSGDHGQFHQESRCSKASTNQEGCQEIAAKSYKQAILVAQGGDSGWCGGRSGQLPTDINSRSFEVARP